MHLSGPHNDEHVILAGLHAAFLKFHNNAVDALRLDGHPESELFGSARRLTVWHYQWLLLHEFLPLFVGQPLVDDILSNGRRFYRPRMGQALMPVEFQGACYRFGHSMIRPSYRANLAEDNGAPFFGMMGLHLEPVGGRIVAEVLIGSLQSDPAAYLAAQPVWEPTLQHRASGFRMTDFLRFAGVGPASRSQFGPASRSQ